MPRGYKRKRQIGYTTDHNANRKSYNSSERWTAKREISAELVELPSNKHDMSELRWQIEQKFSSECYTAESEAHYSNKEYKCKCPNVCSWSDGEVLKYLGLV